MDRVILCDIMETVSQLDSCCCNYETKNSFVSIFSGRKWSHVKDPACNQRVCPLTQTTGWDKTISRQHFKRRNNAAGWIIYVSSTSMDLSRTLAPSRLLARWGVTGLKKTNSRHWCLAMDLFPRCSVFSDWRHYVSQLFLSPVVCQCVIPSSSCTSDCTSRGSRCVFDACKLLVVTSVAMEVHILCVKVLSSFSSSDIVVWTLLQGKCLSYANKCSKNIQEPKISWTILPSFKALCYKIKDTTTCQKFLHWFVHIVMVEVEKWRVVYLAEVCHSQSRCRCCCNEPKNNLLKYFQSFSMNVSTS